MRRALLILCAAALAAPASAAARPAVTASPDPVRFGQELTIKGTGWPVFENCDRTVRLKLKSPQNAFTIATARVRPSGRFTKRWTPERADVAPFPWRLVARQRCDSGNDGSTFFNRARTSVTIGRG